MTSSLSSLCAALVLITVACASAPEPTAASASPRSEGASLTAARGPCAPADCAPCDETKGKCTGPSMCDGHPERMAVVCARDDDGTCRRKNVCN